MNVVQWCKLPIDESYNSQRIDILWRFTCGDVSSESCTISELVLLVLLVKCKWSASSLHGCTSDEIVVYKGYTCGLIVLVILVNQVIPLNGYLSNSDSSKYGAFVERGLVQKKTNFFGNFSQMAGPPPPPPPFGTSCLQKKISVYFAF